MKNIMVDSNIIFSGLLYTGKPSKILKLLRKRRLRLLMPVDELGEIRIVFRRKVSYREYLLDSFLKVVKPKIISAKRYRGLIPSAVELIKDKKDAPILACALAVKPDYFITGDKDFLVKEVQREINSITPAEFLEEIRSTRRK